jgi:hypothetical protein
MIQSHPMPFNQVSNNTGHDAFFANTGVHFPAYPRLFLGQFDHFLKQAAEQNMLV